MDGRHHQIPSPQLGRKIHLWTYGHFGVPVLVFPSAAGFAHEWQAQGMVDALAPLIHGGKIKLYCPESNVSEAWTRRDGSPEWRIRRHMLYEQFIMETLVPAIRADCRTSRIPIATAGTSLGAMYAANFALKFPGTFFWGLCMSGRYLATEFTDGFNNTDVYFNNPLAYVRNLEGAALQHVQERTSLTLVCGQGKYEEGCIEETWALSHLLDRKGIPCERDIWGRDVSHEWPWWRRQARHHLGRKFGG